MEVFVDNVLVKKTHTHLADLYETFAVVSSHGLKLNPTKCAFIVQSGKFLG